MQEEKDGGVGLVEWLVLKLLPVEPRKASFSRFSKNTFFSRLKTNHVYITLQALLHFS